MLSPSICVLFDMFPRAVTLQTYSRNCFMEAEISWQACIPKDVFNILPTIINLPQQKHFPYYQNGYECAADRFCFYLAL